MEYTFTGKVIAGHKLGRKLGFPTANMAMADDAPAPDGVYAARVAFGGGSYEAMASLGRRPSVSDGGERMLEVHLFGFSGDLYDKDIAVELVSFMRPQEKFGSLDELRLRIEGDMADIQEYFNKLR